MGVYSGGWKPTQESSRIHFVEHEVAVSLRWCILDGDDNARDADDQFLERTNNHHCVLAARSL